MTRTRCTLVGFLLLTAALLGCAGDTRVDTPPEEPGPATPGSREPSQFTLPDPTIWFVEGILSHPDLELDRPTALVFGPDGRLYVGELTGRILAITLDDHEVIDVEFIEAVPPLQFVLGMAFNPHEPPDPITLYVSHTALFEGEEGEPYPGTVSKLIGPDFERVDLITGLPVSTVEHGTNGLAFDSDGRLLIAQGGTTNAGLPSERHARHETPLSAAILVADITDPDFDGAVRYDPPGEASPTVNQVGGDVRVYASGFRNPFDLVAHSNGRIYATENGPNIPDGPQALSCDEPGPDPWTPDELILVLEGHYYGHPNPNRGRFAERECVFRAPDDDSGQRTPPIATLGYSTSANGMAEYTVDTFGGSMRGDLVYVEWVTGRVMRVVLSEDGSAVESISQLTQREFDQPLDVTVGPDGTLYIAEFQGDRIAFLRPGPSALLE